MSSNRINWLRKLNHIATGVVPIVGWVFSFELALALAGVLFAASLAIEAARRWWAPVNRVLWRLLPTIFRDWETRRVLGSTWLALGGLAALALFGPGAGGMGFLFLAWGDPAAELAGKRWGRPGAGKSLAGSLGCLAACLAAAAVGSSLGETTLWVAFLGAVVATLAERCSWPPDDNVWMPLLSGLTIWGVHALLSTRTGG